MPLKPGSDKEAVSTNIKEMVASGYPQKQAVAASLSNARRHPNRRRLAVGGVGDEAQGGWWQKDKQDPVIQAGLVPGKTAGRADALNVSVPAGSYVIPADVVSALGEGNTASGATYLDQFLAGKLPKPALARGGSPGALVPVKLSGGEYVVPPQAATTIGEGNPSHGHDVLDAFVKHVRASHIKTLKKLPGPVR